MAIGVVFYRAVSAALLRSDPAVRINLKGQFVWVLTATAGSLRKKRCAHGSESTRPPHSKKALHLLV